METEKKTIKTNRTNVMILKDVAQQFVDWTKKKIHYHIEQERDIYFREKEIWWAALGKNVGYETDGKHELFERPVLILNKYSKDIWVNIGMKG